MSARLGVIGAGFHATRNILPSLALAGIDIAALATRDLARSKAALTRFGSAGRPYASAEELLADATVRDVVVVAQAADQARLALRAIEAGKNVFADKPLGWTAGEARRIADAAEARGVTAMVGFMKRYAPAYRELKSMLDAGELGTLRSFELTFGCDSAAFCADEEDFVKLAAIHVVDLVRFLFGEVTVVHGVSNSAARSVALSVVLGLESGVVGTLNLSGLPSYSSETEMLRVSGEQAHVVVADVASVTIHRADVDASWRALTDTTVTRRPAESAMSGIERDLFQRGFVGELEAFARAAGGGPAPSSTARDNVRTMELCGLILGLPTGVSAGVKPDVGAAVRAGAGAGS